MRNWDEELFPGWPEPVWEEQPVAQPVAGNGLREIGAKERWRVAQPVAQTASRIIIDFVNPLNHTPAAAESKGSSSGLLLLEPDPELIYSEIGPAELLGLSGDDVMESCRECPLPAVWRCYVCGRPICEFHTVLLTVGRPEDKLDMAVCPECEPKGAEEAGKVVEP